MARVTFEVVVPSDPPTDRVVVAGTDARLGDWQPHQGLELERDSAGPVFRGSVELPPGLYEFKLTRGSWETEASYYDGTLCPNDHVLVSHEMTVRRTVEKWGDAPPVDAYLVHGRAVECALHATQFDADRQVVVWLPPSYGVTENTRYPVLYRLDGQEAFDIRSPERGESLAADVWVRNLSRAGIIPEIILVAVCHDRDPLTRNCELSPRCDGAKMSDFLANDLKPFIDFTFCRDRTHLDPGWNGVLGFSMAGSLALMMSATHAKDFGLFAALSPEMEDMTQDGVENCALIDRIECDPAYRCDRRIYVDYGTFGLDAELDPYVIRLAGVWGEKGFQPGKDYLIHQAEGTDHWLSAWRARLGLPLKFLFQPLTGE
jgi:enterochelin esterase-like enzyme